LRVSVSRDERLRENLADSTASPHQQYLRDWLTQAGLKGKEGVEMPAKVVQETTRKYQEAYEKLTGKSSS